MLFEESTVKVDQNIRSSKEFDLVYSLFSQPCLLSLQP